MGLRGSSPQAFRSHQRHINGCSGDHQSLIGADIGGRLGAADMLFTCLKRQDEPWLSILVRRTADNTSRHLAHQRLLASHETEIGSAARQRNSQWLTFTYRHIGTLFSPFARRGEECERHRD